MNTSTKIIGQQSVVIMHFSISLEDGTLAENTRHYAKPAKLTIGDGNLSAEFESLLLGLHAGDKKHFTLAPEAAFGMPDPKNIHTLPRRQFGSDIELETGLIMGFAQPNGVEIPGIIRDFNQDQVTVDFNHPLAGHKVIFDVEILEVDPDNSTI